MKHSNRSATRYIKHLAGSANFKGSGIFNKLCSGLLGNRFEMRKVPHTYRY